MKALDILDVKLKMDSVIVAVAHDEFKKMKLDDIGKFMNAQGETIEETMENVKAAIEAHLLALKEEMEEVPTEEEFVIGRVKVGVSAVV